MIVRFWGVRGSVPWSTAGSIGHGCNTPCVEVRNTVTDEVLILDAGSGIVGVGPTLGAEPRSIPLLLTHFHWDHTQGLPFFDAFYKAAWKTTIFAPRLGTIDEAFVQTIFDSPFYPVPYENLPSAPSVRLVEARQGVVGGFHVRAEQLNHPGGCFAYRIKGAAGDLVYATDHEFGNPAIDEAFGDFARGASHIIMDAHFTPEELPSHKGWGHGTWRQCAEFAAGHDIGTLWLFHHKPGRSDEDMVAIVEDARRVFPNSRAAGEGDAFEV